LTLKNVLKFSVWGFALLLLTMIPITATIAQDHDSKVAPSGGNEHDVAFAYATQTASTGRITIRRTSMTFPTGHKQSFVVGNDTISAGLGAYVIGRAHKLGASKRLLVRMVVNLVIDWLVGLVPLLGDLFDFG